MALDMFITPKVLARESRLLQQLGSFANKAAVR
jgi:hypothetical protein